MDTAPKEDATSRERRDPGLRVAIYFAAYLSINFVWTLPFYPGGTPGISSVFVWGSPENTRLLHLALMYGCMMSVYAFVRCAVGGPWWMGSLAAVLMMANPLKTEAMLDIEQTRALWAAFLALTALAFYAADAKQPASWKAAAFLLCCLASMIYRVNAMLVVVIVAYHFLVQKSPRVHGRSWIGAVGLLVLMPLTYRDLWLPRSWEPTGMFGPLCLIPYPIGLLPETVVWFHHYPWVGWLCAGFGVLVLAGLAKLVAHPAFVFGILAAAVFRLGQGHMNVDWVHMSGGGNLIVPIALANTAFAAFCSRVIQHPKWLRPMVSSTTLLCLLMFILQGRANLAWREAGELTRAFEQDLAQKDTSVDSIGILPDFQCHQGARIGFGQAARRSNPWKDKAIPLLPINYGRNVRVHVESWTPECGRVRVEGLKLAEAMPTPYLLEQVGNRAALDSVELELVGLDAAGFTVDIQPRPFIGKLPTVLIPGEWPPEAKEHP